MDIPFFVCILWTELKLTNEGMTSRNRKVTPVLRMYPSLEIKGKYYSLDGKKEIFADHYKTGLQLSEQERYFDEKMKEGEKESSILEEIKSMVMKWKKQGWL